MKRQVLLAASVGLAAIFAVVAAAEDSEPVEDLCLAIGTAKDRCQYAKDHCASYKLGAIDHFDLYYCTGSAGVRNFIVFPLQLLLLGFLFMSLGVVAGGYLCPNLSAVSRYLHIPDNISGMTLLAFGNDSPDIMSTYSSFRTDNASLAVGELIGAAFFVTCFVIGIVSVIHPFTLLPDRDSEVESGAYDSTYQFVVSNAKMVFFRDIGFFLFTIALLMLYLHQGVLTQPMLYVLVFLYVVYTVTIISWQLSADKKKSALQTDATVRHMYDDEENPVTFGADEREFENDYTFNPAILNNLQFGKIIKNLTKKKGFKLSALPRYSDSQSYEESTADAEVEGDGDGDDEDESTEGSSLEAESSLPGKLATYLTLPVTTVMQYTVPLMTYDHYSTDYRYTFSELVSLMSSLVLSGFVFVAGFIESPTFLNYFEFVSLSVILAAVAYRCLIISDHQSNVIKLVISLCGFVAAISWISLIAQELVNDLKFISVLTLLSEAVLGLTVFAIGNSVGDLISDIVIARLGYPLMALAACLGGPLLNILLGIGGSGLIVGGNLQLQVSGSLYMSCIYIMANLCFMFFYIPANGFRFDKFTGSCMIGLWLVGTLISVLVEIL